MTKKVGEHDVEAGEEAEPGGHGMDPTLKRTGKWVLEKISVTIKRIPLSRNVMMHIIRFTFLDFLVASELT